MDDGTPKGMRINGRIKQPKTGYFHMHAEFTHPTLAPHYSLDTFHWCRVWVSILSTTIPSSSSSTFPVASFALAHSFWQMQFVVVYSPQQMYAAKSTFILRKLLNETMHTHTLTHYVRHTIPWIELIENWNSYDFHNLCVLYIKLKRPLVFSMLYVAESPFHTTPIASNLIPSHSKLLFVLFASLSTGLEKLVHTVQNCIFLIFDIAYHTSTGWDDMYDMSWAESLFRGLCCWWYRKWA